MDKMKFFGWLMASLALCALLFGTSVQAIEEVNKEMIFNQRVIFKGAVEGIDRTAAGMKTFYVLKTSAALFPYAFDSLKPYADGVPRLYTTLDTALASCVASRGDLIYILPGHTETLTAAQSLDIAGVTIIGVGEPEPEYTINGTVDGFTVDAADITLKNIHFPAPGTDSQTSCITITDAGDNFTMKDCTIIGSDTGDNIIDVIVIENDADYAMLDNITIFNNTVAVTSFLTFEGNTTGSTIQNCRWWGDVATGGIVDDGPASGVDMLLIKDCIVGVVGNTKPAITLDSNPEGMIVNSVFFGTHTTLATNFAPGNLVRLSDIRVCEETDGSVQATNIQPALDTN